MSFEATGTVHAILETKQFSEKFSKREFIVTIADNPKYPQLVSFEATKERIDQLNSISVGDTVKIAFNLRGREWKSPAGEVKYYTTLEAWRIDKQGSASMGSANQDSRSATSGAAGNDEIPF